MKSSRFAIKRATRCAEMGRVAMDLLKSVSYRCIARFEACTGSESGPNNRSIEPMDPCMPVSFERQSQLLHSARGEPDTSDRISVGSLFRSNRVFEGELAQFEGAAFRSLTSLRPTRPQLKSLMIQWSRMHPREYLGRSFSSLRIYLIRSRPMPFSRSASLMHLPLISSSAETIRHNERDREVASAPRSARHGRSGRARRAKRSRLKRCVLRLFPDRAQLTPDLQIVTRGAQHRTARLTADWQDPAGVSEGPVARSLHRCVIHGRDCSKPLSRQLARKGLLHDAPIASKARSQPIRNHPRSLHRSRGELYPVLLHPSSRCVALRLPSRQLAGRSRHAGSARTAWWTAAHTLRSLRRQPPQSAQTPCPSVLPWQAWVAYETN